MDLLLNPLFQTIGIPGSEKVTEIEPSLAIESREQPEASMKMHAFHWHVRQLLDRVLTGRQPKLCFRTVPCYGFDFWVKWEFRDNRSDLGGCRELVFQSKRPRGTGPFAYFMKMRTLWR